MRFLSCLLLVPALLIAASATRVEAQTNHTTSVTLSTLLGSNPTPGAEAAPVASARVCAVAKSVYANPLSFSAVGWGLIPSGTAFCGTVTAGALSGGLNVPDACHTNYPGQLNYDFTFQTLVAGVPSGQPVTLSGATNVCGTTWALDNYTPATATSVPTGLQSNTSVPSTCANPFLDLVTTGDSTTLYLCSNGVPVATSGGSALTLGTAAGTAAAGNDARIVNAVQTPTMPAGEQCEIIYAGGSGTTWPANVGGFTTTLATGSQAPTWVNGGLFFTMANNQYATLPGGCTNNAQTIMLVYTADATQLTNDVVPGGNTEFGVMLFSDSNNEYITSLPGIPNQGPNIQNFGGVTVQTLDHATGAVDATFAFGSNPQVYIDGHPPVSSLASGGSSAPFASTGNIWLASFNGDAGLQWGGTIHAIATWPTQLTEAQVAQAHQYIASKLAPYGVYPEQKQDYDKPVVIFTGDSITADSGWAYQYFNSIPAQAMAILGTEPNYYNMAHGGYNTANLIAEFPQSVAPMLRLHSGPKYVKLASGTNDLGGSSESTILTSEQTYCGMVNAMSASCAVTTVMPATRNTSDQETARQALNAALVAGVLNGSLGAVSLSDWHNDPIMGNAGNLGNTCYFYDHLHPGYCNQGAIRGAALLARRDALAIHRMTNPQVPYWIQVTVNQYAFTGVSATAYTMPLLQLIPHEKVCGVTSRIQTALAGPSISALTFSIGNTLGSATTYASAASALTATTQDYTGPTNVPETGVVNATWAATGANLSATNAGTMDIDICVVTQP